MMAERLIKALLPVCIVLNLVVSAFYAGIATEVMYFAFEMVNRDVSKVKYDVRLLKQKIRSNDESSIDTHEL